MTIEKKTPFCVEMDGPLFLLSFFSLFSTWYKLQGPTRLLVKIVAAVSCPSIIILHFDLELHPFSTPFNKHIPSSRHIYGCHYRLSRSHIRHIRITWTCNKKRRLKVPSINNGECPISSSIYHCVPTVLSTRHSPYPTHLSHSRNKT